MSHKNPASIIAIILTPFVVVWRIFADRIVILIDELADIIWTCLIKIPMEINNLKEQLQIWQYALEIIHNLTSLPLLQGILQSVSPFAGLVWLLFGGYIFFKIIFPAIVDAL